MPLIPIGQFEAAGDETTAHVIRQPGSSAQSAVKDVAAPLVASAIADDGTVVTAAVDAMAEAALQSEALRTAYVPRLFGATNLAPHPTFDAGETGWARFGGGVPVIAGGEYRIVADGTFGRFGMSTAPGYRFPGVRDHVIFVYVQMMSDTTVPLRIDLENGLGGVLALDGITDRVPHPATNTWYDVAGTVKLPAAFEVADVRTYFRAAHPSAAAASGKVLGVRKVTILDLTAIFGAGNEPPAADVVEVLRNTYGGVLTTAPQAFTTSRGAALDQQLARIERARPHSATSGPHVVIRTDDGYYNNFSVMAPHLAKRGFTADLYMATHPTQWMGTVKNGLQVMGVPELVSLQRDYGWTVGVHMTQHQNVNSMSQADLGQDIRAAIGHLTSYGLPWPEIFAHPNGDRSASADRMIYQMMSKLGLTGHPNRIPVRFDQPVLFSGWIALGRSGSVATEERLVEMAKSYIRESFKRGEIPTLGFHSILPTGAGSPVNSFDLPESTFVDLIDWIHAEGFPVGSIKDTLPHNLLQDPGFELNEVRPWADGSYPWGVNAAGWERVAEMSDPNGTKVMRIDASTPISGANARSFQQRVRLSPGTYSFYTKVRQPSWVSGSVRVNAYFLDVLGNEIGMQPDVVTFPAAAQASWLVRPKGTIVVPAGTHSVDIQFQTHSTFGYQGVAEVSWSTLFGADQYDPFAAA